MRINFDILVVIKIFYIYMSYHIRILLYQQAYDHATQGCMQKPSLTEKEETPSMQLCFFCSLHIAKATKGSNSALVTYICTFNLPIKKKIIIKHLYTYLQSYLQILCLLYIFHLYLYLQPCYQVLINKLDQLGTQAGFKCFIVPQTNVINVYKWV